MNIKESKAIYYVVEVYLTRWKCDECYRYIKQSYNLEDVRVRSYTAIRNTVALVHAIAYFTSVYMGLSLKLKVAVQKIFILSKPRRMVSNGVNAFSECQHFFNTPWQMAFPNC